MEPGTPSDRDRLEWAITGLNQGRPADVLAELRDLHDGDPSLARARAYLGLATGVVERRFDRGLELCRSAVKQEFFNPELYHVMARLHLAFGFKSDAVRYLRRGLMIDPADPAIARALHQLGARRSQVLGFLPRNHFLNRWFGRTRQLWAQRAPARPVTAADAAAL